MPCVAAFSPDGSSLLVGTAYGDIVRFDRQGRRQSKMAGHRARLVAIVFSGDGRLVGSASVDGTARLWHADGTPIAVLRGPDGPVYDCAFMGKQLWTAHDGGAVRKWYLDVDDLVRKAQAMLSRKELTLEERDQYAQLLPVRRP